ncbi:signal peptide peptidase SppA [Porticoccus sp. W117]|uniref:signal peptide peptidase SppA n=1 Tax=Porticoccus sp. W117 TaxID=3054777 RepID=UPI0025974CDD|nr:signal peptide peptidase SppA [Porticoccus sp. W117]MDM3870102.1 signal peptide peptidase SppA [Porticoccus sp. W117]
MTDKPKGIFRRFFGFIGNTLLGLLKSIARLLISAVVIITVAVVLIALFTRPEPIPESAALVIAPQGSIVEQLNRSPSPMALLAGQPKETRLSDLLGSIRAAAKDERINSLILNLDGMSGTSFNKLSDIGDALQEFRDSGKPITVAGDNFNQGQYFLASHADRILLNPFGAVEVMGFARYRPYFKDALDKLKINVHVFKVGSFKDAVEPFLRNDMSEASKLHNSEWLNLLWADYTSRVESLRGLPKGALNGFINAMDSELQQHNGDTAKLALENGLVDQLATSQQMHDALVELAGDDGNGGYRQVGMKRYLQDIFAQREADNMFKEDKVALVVASGEILDGEQPAGKIGGDSLAELLSQVRDDPAIKALVLRVDSPGGSAYASEVIRQEILQIKAQGIPVVISMGSLAASGGYWISANADQIWASPTTLTGSIGVFGMIPTFENSFAELGISSDGIATTELAGFGNPTRPMSEKGAAVIQSAIDGIYQKFLTLVAEGRNSSSEEVHKVAQGRVWTGAKAKQLGLVDELGNLKDAIVAAAKLADISEYKVELIQQPLSFQEALMLGLTENVDLGQWLNIDSLIPQSIQQTANPLVEALNDLNDPKGYYLRCYECGEL